jgi:hypothetical protein
MQQPIGSSTSVVPASDYVVALSGQAGATAKSHEPAVNTAAVVTLAVPGSGISHVLYSVAWSYDADPTGGALTIAVDSATWFKVDIVKAGPGQFMFSPPLKATANKAVVVTLAAGGAAANGIVNVHSGLES